MTDYDICILGGGIAGLYCAREIKKAWPDSRVAIIEKYKILGGRMHTYHKNIEGIGEVRWENGAGRIHKSHSHTLDLLKEYELDVIPIPAGLDYRPAPDAHPEKIDIGKMMENFRPVSELPQETLQQHTLSSLLSATIGSQETLEIRKRFEYNSEMDTLRADKGFFSLFGEIGHQENFFVVKDGFTALASAIIHECEDLGVEILREMEVDTIEKETPNYKVVLKGHNPISCSRVIVALHRDGVAGLKCFKGHPLLKVVKMRPLVRMYALFPVAQGKQAWFSDLKKFVCKPPIRYVIPIDPTRGIIMISYTDGADAEYWLKKVDSVKQEKIEAEVMGHIRALFPERKIPDPVFFKVHPWYDGCSYWTPGNYDIEKASWAAIRPLETMPDVWMCGESWNPCQCWVDSALNHAKRLLEKFLKTPML
jgi:hypothetical protein